VGETTWVAKNIIKRKSMRYINFNDNELVNVHPKDLMSFFSMLYSDERFKKGRVFVNTTTKSNDKDYKTMVTITIKFQHFKPKEKGSGSKFEWISYRAKEFSCSNNQIVEVIE
jgi:hypothetical protein